ncbi:MAG TPA: lauroyl acyltransferase [Stellaceae bacterium]|jgi:KDO2-lipid IV(A) lauroyltransferase
MADRTTTMDAAVPHAPQRKPVTLRRRLEGWGARLLFALFRALPVDAASALGGRIARTVGPRLGVTKRALINLRCAMPELSEADLDRTVTGMWDNLGRVVAEYPHLTELRVYEPGGRVETVGIDLVDPLIAAGKRIIFFSAHYGNWEVTSAAATQKGLSVAQIYRAANNPLIDDLIAETRGAVGSELIPKGAVAARRAIEALKEGRHLAMLVDQKMNDGISVPFFGRDAMTAPALAQLALRFDCAVVPARVERVGGARFRLVVSPPIEIERTGDRHADTLTLMTRVNREIEGWIRARPELWFWLHRRWPD